MSLDLDAILARAEAATPGPWTQENDLIYSPDVEMDGERQRAWIIMLDCYDREEDIQFILHARQDIPALVAEVRRLEAENERLTVNNAKANYVICWEEVTKQAERERDEARAELTAQGLELERARAALAEATDEAWRKKYGELLAEFSKLNESYRAASLELISRSLEAEKQVVTDDWMKERSDHVDEIFKLRAALAAARALCGEALCHLVSYHEDEHPSLHERDPGEPGCIVCELLCRLRAARREAAKGEEVRGG